MKNWQILNSLNTKHKTLKTDEILKIILQNRGLKSKQEIDDFLNPPKPYTLNPKTLGIKPDQLKKAVERIKKAISEKESIVVYGDYDADGVCSTAVVWEALNKLGAKVMPYIPHRVDEGYGLSQKGIDAVKKEYQASLIITVDHGISAFEKVAYAQKQGVDVIITDHHVAPEKLPDACAVVHTTELCGAGVGWMLAQAVISNLKLQISNSLDLVAIATIADMVPLTGVNRILVKYGLKQLNQTERPGLKSLIKEAGIEKNKIGTYEVSHILAPRLNAMGRLEHAMDSLRLLCTNDKERANQLARLLDQTNRERQKITEETASHAKNLLTGSVPEFAIKEKLIFLVHESYNQGIIGLVAGKMVEQYYRPAIVIAKGEEFSKASARSISGFNIIEVIRQASDLLVDAGGHPMAAGFTVETKNLKALEKKLREIAEKEIDEEMLTRILKIDCELDLNDLNFKLFEELDKLKPYGIGNYEPVFVSYGVRVKEAKTMGQDKKHLRMQITQPRHPELVSGSVLIPAIAFGFGELFPQLSPDRKIDIAYTLSVNEWNGDKKLELKIKDIKIDQQ